MRCIATALEQRIQLGAFAHLAFVQVDDPFELIVELDTAPILQIPLDDVFPARSILRVVRAKTAPLWALTDTAAR